MKNFIITLSRSGEHHPPDDTITLEVQHTASSWLDLVKTLHNLSLRVRTIEEVPLDAVLEQRELVDLRIGEAERYRIRSLHDASPFPE